VDRYKIDDASVRLAMAKNEFPKIPVVGDKDTALPLRDGKHLFIG
jgi:hypothetical protein